MLKLFFNRFSPLVMLVEVAGVVLFITGVVRGLNDAGPVSLLLLAIVVVEYAFIRFCSLWRWYKGAPRYSGIELHFKKSIVATSYVILATGIALNFGLVTVPLAASMIILCIAAYVNVMLVSHHLRDRDATPPNFFSKRLFCRPDPG